jgi:hypothetical protein
MILAIIAFCSTIALSDFVDCSSLTLHQPIYDNRCSLAFISTGEGMKRQVPTTEVHLRRLWDSVFMATTIAAARNYI